MSSAFFSYFTSKEVTSFFLFQIMFLYWLPFHNYGMLVEKKNTFSLSVWGQHCPDIKDKDTMRKQKQKQKNKQKRKIRQYP